MQKFFVNFRGALRFVLFVALIAVFMAWSMICMLFNREYKQRMKVYTKNVCFFSGCALWLFNVKKLEMNQNPVSGNYLLVANHMGFIDILIIASMAPSLFITSREMRETPFLGTLTEMAGCIYTERRSRTQILNEVQNIVQALKDGFNVGLYPEATSTNGEQVLPFKRTLMTSAAHANVPILPVAINFRSINNEPFTLKWRDNVCWYGETTFIQALWRALTLKEVEVEIKYLEPLFPTVDDDRGKVADMAHHRIATEFRPVQLA